MNARQFPTNEWNSISKVLSSIFLISIILMVGSILFETLSFEQQSVFDKPIRINSGSVEKQNWTIGIIQPLNGFGE